MVWGENIWAYSWGLLSYLKLILKDLFALSKFKILAKKKGYSHVFFLSLTFWVL